MRVPIASAIIVGSLAVTGAAAQSGGKPPAASTANPACALLTREIVTKYSATPNARLLDLIPPQGEPIGAKGSACEYGGIHLQIDPFANPDYYRKSPQKDWQVVSGVGDTAYFHNNRNNYAELMVFAGSRHFTIQMSVPMGGNADSFKSNTIALANALLLKLR